MVRCTRQRSVDLVTTPGDLESYVIADCKYIQTPIPGKKISTVKVFSTRKEEKLLRGRFLYFVPYLHSVWLVKTETICGEFRTNQLDDLGVCDFSSLFFSIKNSLTTFGGTDYRSSQ
jgi:hypothetical protein